MRSSTAGHCGQSCPPLQSQSQNHILVFCSRLCGKFVFPSFAFPVWFWPFHEKREIVENLLEDFQGLHVYRKRTIFVWFPLFFLRNLCYHLFTSLYSNHQRTIELRPHIFFMLIASEHVYLRATLSSRGNGQRASKYFADHCKTCSDADCASWHSHLKVDQKDESLEKNIDIVMKLEVKLNT